MKLLLGLLCATAITAIAPTASATVIVAGSGWQDDSLTTANASTTSSPWTFTVTGPAVFSVSDAFIVGDIYKLFDTATSTLLATSTFFAGLAGDVQSGTTGPAGGTFGPAWQNVTFSKFAYTLAAGTYSFTITGDGAGGLPAGLGVRLDLIGGVPEPTSWAMMILGFGLAGTALRRRHAFAA